LTSHPYTVIIDFIYIFVIYIPTLDVVGVAPKVFIIAFISSAAGPA